MDSGDDKHHTEKYQLQSNPAWVFRKPSHFLTVSQKGFVFFVVHPAAVTLRQGPRFDKEIYRGRGTMNTTDLVHRTTKHRLGINIYWEFMGNKVKFISYDAKIHCYFGT